MGPDDVFETALGLEAKAEGSPGIKVARPAGNDFGNCFVIFTADEFDYIVACDRTERLDLFGYSAGEAGQGEGAAVSKFFRVQSRCLDEEQHRGAGRSMPMANGVAHGKYGLFPGERLADDVGKEPGGGEIGLAGAHADGWHAERHPIKEAAAGVIIQQKFVDRLLGAIAGERRCKELVANGIGEGGAENRNGGREDKLWLVAATRLANDLEENAGGIEIDAVTFFEILLRFAGYDRCEVAPALSTMG